MTRTATTTHDDLDNLLVATNRALENALAAVLNADKHAAHEVLRTSAARRRARAAAIDTLRTRTAVPLPRLIHELQFADDIGEVSEVADQLARHILGGGDSAVLTSSQLGYVRALHDAANRRLHDLRNGLAGPSLNHEYRSCGDTLREAGAQCSHNRSATLTFCAALASALVRASRHATYAA